MINGLDLFSGIGGLSLALGEWVLPKAYCEIDRYAQSVLLSRMSEGELYQAPIWDDIRTLKGDMLPAIDMVYGGFPCQDISTAGHGRGLEGQRSELFFEIVRLIGEIRPKFVFLENVPALTVRGLERVLLEITALGYDCRWTIVSAAEIGACHLRERIFILAHTNGESLRLSEPGEQREKIHAASALENGKTTNSTRERKQPIRDVVGSSSKEPFSLLLLEGNNWDEYASFLLRVDNGLRVRSHQIKGLGNAVVPLQAREAFKRLITLGGV